MSFTRINPANALKRASDFKMAGDKTKALEHIFDVLMAKNSSSQYTPNHYNLIIEFIDLCVEFRETRKCKEGLNRIRNFVSSYNREDYDRIINHLIDSSIKKLEDAHTRVLEHSKGAVLSDLSVDEQSPESLLLASVSSVDIRERAEREIIGPWSKHLNEITRSIIEPLYRVVGYENLISKTATKIMASYVKFDRVTDFRKFSSSLRKSWDPTKVENAAPEVLICHLKTRFAVLQYCADLNLWNESYNTLNDIKRIMALNPKLKFLHPTQFFEILSRTFWQANNILHHTYAYKRFYNVAIASKDTTKDENNVMFSALLLSAMTIPLTKPSHFSDESVLQDRSDKHTNLINTCSTTPIVAPSRDSILEELKPLIHNAYPEVAELFDLLESSTLRPLDIIPRSRPLLAQIEARSSPIFPRNKAQLGSSEVPHSTLSSPTLSQFVPLLRKLVVIRAFEQLSRVYSTIAIPSLRETFEGIGLSFFEIEVLAKVASKAGLLSVRIDYRSGVVHLQSRESAASVAQTQKEALSVLSSKLRATVQATGRDCALVPFAKRQAVANAAKAVHTLVVTETARRNRDETLVARVVAPVDRAKEQQAREQKQRQLEEEERKRREEEEAIRKEQEASKAEEAKKAEEEAKRIKEMELRIRKENAKEQALIQMATRANYFVRAVREKNRTLLAGVLEKKKLHDREYVEKTLSATHGKEKALLEAYNASKAVLDPLRGFAEQFEKEIKNRRIKESQEKDQEFYMLQHVRFLRGKVERAEERQKKAAK